VDRADRIEVRMKLVVDANPLFPLSPELGPTGVGRWAAGAVSSLARVAPDWEIELVAFHLQDATLDTSYMGPNVSFKQVHFSNRLHRKLMVLGIAPHLERFIGSADAMLGPGFVSWPMRRGVEIPVIHDLTYLRFPRYVSRRNLYYLRAVMPRVMKRAGMIVTVSETVRAEISEHFTVDPDRIAIVPNGYDSAHFERGGRRWGIAAQVPDRYLLFVGTLEPRKNLVGVLDALESLRSRRADVPVLVIAGGLGWRNDTIARRLDALAGDDAVRILGYVDDTDLATLYSRATALVFPSFYEGFGLPLLEAMAAGCPVIVSDRGALPEVGGDCALYVDPDDPASIGAAIEQVVDDPASAAHRAQAGLERASGFTWDRAGAALKVAIERAIVPSGPR
jgi:glycosyltransferase involved in cell wall biosynthesis